MQGRRCPSLFVFDDHWMALGHSTYESGDYGNFAARDEKPSAFDATRRADDVDSDAHQDSFYIHPATEWVEDLFEKEREERDGVEATTRACRHGHLADASRLLLDGTVLPCSECLPIVSVDEAGEVPTSKGSLRGGEQEDLFTEAGTDTGPLEPILVIDGGRESEPASPPAHVDEDALPEGSRRGSRAREVAAVFAPATDGVDLLQAAEDAPVEDGADDAASSYSERSATPGPSRMSATRSSAARSSAKGRGRKAGGTASSNNTTLNKPLNRTKSTAGKEAEAMKKTDAVHYVQSYEHALSILDAMLPSKPAASVVDAALLAVGPYDPLPADSTSPPLPTEGKLDSKELRVRREARLSFCMVCNMRFGKLRGASYYRQHRIDVCALWRVLVTLDLATKWLRIHHIDESICGRMQFESNYPRDHTYRTMENDKCAGYDEEGWRILGTQLQDREAAMIKAKLPEDVSALRAVIIAERDARLATTAAATKAGSRKRRAEDEGERARGSKRQKNEEDA